MRTVRYVTVASADDPLRWGIGECSPLPLLSCDDLPDYDARLSSICRNIEASGSYDLEELRPYPSILFGIETAFRHLETGGYALWDTAFSRGEEGIPINGLVWMGSRASMLRQINNKLDAGFRCIKLKIGAIDFDDEIALIRHIRRKFSVDEVEIRVDANGSFSPEEAPAKLERLAVLGVASIEQPICAGQWEVMANLVAQSPIPIALDEDLIACNDLLSKRMLLETVRPHFIILKPSLHGGFRGCGEWIAEAQRINAGWWITSALESNIGLNAIAQWCATLGNPLPQGLGTGKLFTVNAPAPIAVHGSLLHFVNSADSPAFPLPLRGNGIVVQTSGSTGRSKTINIRKELIAHSARLTIAKLGLHPGDTALMCMPQKYIGALMMSARTLVGGLNLVVREPSGHPLAGIDYDFTIVAMTPMQVYNTMQVTEEKETLRHVQNLLIGGAPVDEQVEQELASFPNAVYSTYGMTETVSHIALRRLNGPEASPWYEPLPGIELSLGDENSLIINAPQLSDLPIHTNDIAELMPDGRFRILGRTDLTVNSGGIKIQIELIEDKLRGLIPQQFAITYTHDPKFGQAIVLLIASRADIDYIRRKFSTVLTPFEHPKRIIEVAEIPITQSGKIDRAACKLLAEHWKT
jgi:o-succinylbenzoate synthase